MQGVNFGAIVYHRRMLQLLILTPNHASIFSSFALPSTRAGRVACFYTRIMITLTSLFITNLFSSCV